MQPFCKLDDPRISMNIQGVIVDLKALRKAWFAIQVRSKCEPNVAEALKHKGYEEFLPMYTVRRRWSDRWKEIELPLFAGYVFCRFDQGETRGPIVTTPGVIRIVSLGRELTPISDREIESIRAILIHNRRATPCRFGQIGDRVRVVVGPLAGIEGTLTAFKNRSHLVLSVATVQNSIAVEIDETDVIKC
jgi:transcription antitermination factor NusG